MDRINNSLELALNTESLKSPATTPSSTVKPDGRTAALLGSIIDRARAAVGWGRLPEKEHDIAVLAYYEILSDAGVRPEQYMPCYRAAQQHKSELVRQGQLLTLVTAHDMCAELDKVRRMNAELDKTRLLTENAAAACQRCWGKGRAEMMDGSIGPDCDHTPLTKSEIEERAKFKADNLKRILAEQKQRKSCIRPEPPPRIEKVKGETLRCSDCPREVNSLMGWVVGDECGVIIERERISEDETRLTRCMGRMVKS